MMVRSQLSSSNPAQGEGSAKRATGKKTYIRIGVLGFGGFMFIASTI
jgi:hypothetical protein